MSGALSRRKGANGEREVARLIRDLLGVQMRRRLSQYQRGGEFDLEPADGSALLAGHAIEIKRARKATQAAVARWWKEACDQAGMREPVLWFRADGEDWRIQCRLSIAGRQMAPVLTPQDWAAVVVHGGRVGQNLADEGNAGHLV